MITEIGDYAFAWYAGTSFVIPDSVTSIGDCAFYGCSGLQSVTIGNGVTSIGNNAFEGCINLIQKDNGVGYVEKWVVDCDSSVTGANIRSDTVGIADSAFSGCKTLKSVTIPDSVTSIGNSAFAGCSGLQSLTIGNGVTSIGSSAFYNCTALSTLNWNAVNVSGFNLPNYVFYNAGTGGNGISVTFGDSVERIPNYLFHASNSNNPKIAGIKIGNNVKSIGFWAFGGVSSVSSVIIPASVESIGNYAFSSINTIYCEAQTKPTSWSSKWAGSSSNVIWGHNNEDSGEFSYVVRNNKTYITEYKGSGTEVTIPDTLSEYQVVGFGEIFKNNTNITKVVIGNNVTSVFPYAFYGCSGLTEVTIGNGVTSIGNYAFSGCSRLTSVTIPNSITSIGDYAFYGCSRLTSVTIPDSVTSIGHYAFYNCSSLTSITIPDSVTSIVWNAFSGCSGL